MKNIIVIVIALFLSLSHMAMSQVLDSVAQKHIVDSLVQANKTDSLKKEQRVDSLAKMQRQDSLLKVVSAPVVPVKSFPEGDENKYNLRQFGRELGDYFVSPFHWKGKDFLKLGGVAVFTYGIIQLDEPIRGLSVRNDAFKNNFVMRSLGDEWGGFFVTPVMAVGITSYALISKDNFARKIGFEIAEAGLFSETVSFLSKFLVGRGRPYYEHGAYYYKSPTFFNPPINSMPAGHADAAFAMSTVLSKNAKKPFWKVMAYVPAALTFISRVYTDQHWTSDVFVGAALGHFVACWVVNQHEHPNARVQISSIYPVGIKIGLD